MANTGKFIDRSPSVRPAGSIIYNPEQNVANCLHYITFQEELGTVISSFPKKPKQQYVRAEPSMSASGGYYTELRSIISPARKAFFQELESELQETAYKSYWTKELGSLPDQIPGLPFGMNAAEAVFGKPSPKSDTAQEVVNPSITSGEVNLIAELGHELYRTTHNSFFPGEQKSRKYNVIGLKEKVHGAPSHTGVSASESAIQNVIQWKNMKDFIIGPQNLASYKQRNSVKVGKVSEKLDTLPENLPKGFSFGVIKKVDEPNVEELLKNYSSSNTEKKTIYDAIAYLYGLRTSLSKRFPPFSFIDYAAAFRNVDDKNCECLPLDLFYKISQDEGINLEKKYIDPLIKKLGILHGEKNLVNYNRFTKIIDAREPFPDVGKIEDIPRELCQLESTYKTDYVEDLEKKKEYEKLRYAGIPASYLRYKYSYLQAQHLCKANLDDFPTSTTVESCLSPGLFPSLGVGHKDFFKPRSKEYIRDIFKRIGVEFPDNIFEKLWEEAIRRDGTNVCIQTFRNILDEVTATQLLQGAEM